MAPILQEERLQRLKLRMKVYFDSSRPDHQSLLQKQGGRRATWEYPFAVAGLNITFLIMQMLDLHSSKPRRLIGAIFMQMLSEDEWAFDLLYCMTFMVMDKQWLAKNALTWTSIVRSCLNLLEKLQLCPRREVLRSPRFQPQREFLLDDVCELKTSRLMVNSVSNSS